LNGALQPVSAKAGFLAPRTRPAIDNRSVLYERIPKCSAISGSPPAVSRIRLMRVFGDAKLLILG
jgi:hypothetical protein